MAGTRSGAKLAVATRRRNKAQEERREFLARENERGRSAGKFISGLEVNLQSIREEYVPALRDPKARVAVYDQMANDAKVKSQLRANMLPLISSVHWKVEGGTPEMQDLVRSNLLREGDPKFWCETSWKHRFFEMLQCLKYGYAIFGKTWDVVDGYRILRGLTYLHPRSIGGTLGAWEWDDDERLIAIHRKYRKPSGSMVADERIPIGNVFLVVWELTGENWEGVSSLRSMYRSYSEKDLAAKIQMIHLLNCGVGIPDAEMGPNDGVKDRDNLVQIVSDLRQGNKDRAFIVRAPGQKVGFMTATGQPADAQPILSEKNMEIAAAGGNLHKEAGQTDSGSRASSSVVMVGDMLMLDAIREILQEQVNHGAGYLDGLVEELIDNNFVNVKEYPKIIGSRVSPTEQLDNIPHIGDLTSKGVIPPARTICNEALRRLNWPELSEKEYGEAVKTQRPNQGGRPNEVGDSDREEPRDDKASREFGLIDSAQKKTPGASPTMRSGASYPWLRSSPA